MIMVKIELGSWGSPKPSVSRHGGRRSKGWETLHMPKFVYINFFLLNPNSDIHIRSGNCQDW